jgi:CheY-like chemotaxis protein
MLLQRGKLADSRANVLNRRRKAGDVYEFATDGKFHRSSETAITASVRFVTLSALRRMGGLLRKWGCRVVAAASPDGILAGLAGQGAPDLIISDYRLANGHSGIKAIDDLRRSFGAPVPAFLISGDTAPERLREARESGHHLLHKPVRPMKLRAMLHQFLKNPPVAGAA